ncbi:amidase [Nostoc flagelliforme FACHB-838]|uniref:Amidase n=1 Tax=Nostoc flagelliforme FACHB-838 TaxID=2692904 RepID=A0ABR8DKS7_9NOSO|nr:amidase [Nostoc flagelliforme]MBD2530064.1 amidase [Nostoc flagelliforme FACHB-838]
MQTLSISVPKTDGKRWREMELLAIAQKLDQVINAFHNPLGY